MSYYHIPGHTGSQFKPKTKSSNFKPTQDQTSDYRGFSISKYSRQELKKRLKRRSIEMLIVIMAIILLLCIPLLLFLDQSTENSLPYKGQIHTHLNLGNQAFQNCLHENIVIDPSKLHEAQIQFTMALNENPLDIEGHLGLLKCLYVQCAINECFCEHILAQEDYLLRSGEVTQDMIVAWKHQKWVNRIDY